LQLVEACAGNLHLNIVAASYSPEIQAALEPFVYELVGKYEKLRLGCDMVSIFF